MPPASGSRIVIPGFTPPPEGKSVRVDANGHAVAVFNVRGSLFALGAECSHQSGPLDEGDLSEHRIECPWHGSVFDIETGKVLRGPAETPVAAYRAFMDKEGLVLEPRPFDSGVPTGH
jgi:nitrite reductase/ring-hydroxylating ferredoxin subunit